MSVAAGVGIAVPVDGPLPVPRPYSLLRTPGVVIEDARDEEEEPRWMAGVQVWGYPAGTPHTWEPCSTGTFREKAVLADGLDEDDDPMPGDRFDPIAVYFPLQCSSFDAHDESFQERARLVLDATLSHGVEAALAKGVSGSNNASLGDGDLEVLSASAVSPRVGLSYLENAIGFKTGRMGMIEATPAVVAAWGFGAGLSDDDVDEAPPERALRTSNGTPIISGSGFIGTHPVGQPGPDETIDWVFATGPIEVRLGQAPRISLEESLDREINLVTVRPERFVVYDWDKALQVGIRIDWSSG